MKNYNDNPTISDTIVFPITTTYNDDLIDPYKVNSIVIYFIERGFTVENIRKYTTTIGDQVFTQYFKDAVPVEIFGNSDTPAWLSTDTDNAFITREDEGTFTLEWTPQLAREGDYLLCYSYTVVNGGDVTNSSLQFYLFGDTKQTTSIPTHFTPANKYETLLDLGLPEMFKMWLSENDLSPEILEKLNKSVAKGFTTVEDLANQIIDLIDSNATSDVLLPYLGNLFGINLKSSDITLWRKQIKRAIPLYKKKGTISGLQEALANADIEFKSLTRMWQVVSQFTWQEAFVVTDQEEFELEKQPLLPKESTNYELYLNDEELSLDYVSFSGNTMTWVGDNLSVTPITLEEDDVVRIIYKIAEPDNQTIEDYIRSLPLADQREITNKNWNVKLISEDDIMFDLIVTERHPFNYPLIYGQVRTEFPYSENIYNMEEYNSSTRDSTNPCDLDSSFYDTCTSCQSSKFTIDVEIEDLSAQRIQEASDIIRDYMPFHAVPHLINYSGSKHEYIPSPIEEIEILGTIVNQESIIATQMNFNRLIEEGSSDVDELKRNMLASTSSTSTSGTGKNTAITLFSPGIKFNTLGVSPDNYLEILSGSDQGEYSVNVNQKYNIDIVQGDPDTIGFPLDTGGFPFRLSNEMFADTASVYQDDVFIFADDDDNELIYYGAVAGWKIVVLSGPYAGTYTITSVNSNNTVSVSSFPTVATQVGLSYELRTELGATRFSGNGTMIAQRRGRVEIDLVAQELGFRIADYVKVDGTQYKIIDMQRNSVDELYIEDYTDGDVVGTANIVVYRRLVDNATGYLGIRGMVLTGTTPTISYDAETNQFLENYLILIGSDYYKILEIDGSDMTLSGPMISWGLSPVAVSYDIVQFIKTSPITAQDGHTFARLDRRGNNSIEVTSEEVVMPIYAIASMLNDINAGKPIEAVSQQEKIWFDIEFRS